MDIWAMIFLGAGVLGIVFLAFFIARRDKRARNTDGGSDSVRREGPDGTAGGGGISGFGGDF